LQKADYTWRLIFCKAKKTGFRKNNTCITNLPSPACSENHNSVYISMPERHSHTCAVVIHLNHAGNCWQGHTSTDIPAVLYPVAARTKPDFLRCVFSPCKPFVWQQLVR
jgi:hypothetical protein